MSLVNDATLEWQKGDSIYVLQKDKVNARFNLIGDGGSTSGRFSGTLQGGTTPYYVLFARKDEASQGNAKVSDNELEFKVLQDKPAQSNDITSHGFPAVAELSGNSMQFRNIFGLLKLTLKSETAVKIYKIALHDLAGNMLWGDCSVPIENGELKYENIELSNGDNTITMTWKQDGKGTELNQNAKSYYFPVPPGALGDGFSIVLYDKTGTAYSFLQKITGTIAMPRNGILTVSATVTDKHEPLNVNERGFYKSLFVNAGMYLSNYYKAEYTGITDNNYNNNGATNEGIQAITDLNLANDYEYFASHKTADYNGETGILQSDNALQNSILVQSDIDDNGVLLYPDGSPRFRMVYVNGGQSKNHGPSLGYRGRARFKTFFENGGSYAASCAGSFLASKRVDDVDQSGESGYTFNIFPGNLCHTNLPISINTYSNIYTNMEVIQNTGVSQINLLQQTDIYEEQKSYNGTSYPKDQNDVNYKGIIDVSHHGGSYLPTADCNNSDEYKNDNIGGLQLLMRYRYSTTETNFLLGTTNEDYYRIDNFHTPSAIHNNQTTDKNARFWGNHPVSAPGNTHLISTWAYKPAGDATGRAVCTGSHPEYTARESDKSFTKFMFQYALDGVGKARIKTVELNVGSAVQMADTPENYNSPEANNAPIGDRQYHHFKFTTNQETNNFVLRLESKYGTDSGINLYLGLRKLREDETKDDPKNLAWLSDADYTLCNKGGQKEIRIKKLPAGIWYISVFCATTVESIERTGAFPKYFEYTGNTEVLNGIPYSITINSGYTGAADGNAPASNYGTGTVIGNDFSTAQFTPDFDN